MASSLLEKDRSSKDIYDYLYNCAINKTPEAWGETFRSEVMYLALTT